MYTKLNKMRKKRGLSLREMGEVINVSPPNYYKKEKGDVSFTLVEAQKIAKFFKTKVDKIF